MTIVLLKQCSYWEVYLEKSAHRCPWFLLGSIARLHEVSALCLWPRLRKYSEARFAALKPLDQMVPPRPRADEQQGGVTPGREGGCQATTWARGRTRWRPVAIGST